MNRDLRGRCQCPSDLREKGCRLREHEGQMTSVRRPVGLHRENGRGVRVEDEEREAGMDR